MWDHQKSVDHTGENLGRPHLTLVPSSPANKTRQGKMPMVLPVIGSLTHESRAIFTQLSAGKFIALLGHSYSFQSTGFLVFYDEGSSKVCLARLTPL